MAALLAAMLAASACALPRKDSAPGGGQLRVRLLAGEQVLQTFVATGIRPRPRPALATMVLPVATGKTLWATSARRGSRKSVLFVLHEGGVFVNAPSFAAVDVSTPDTASQVTMPASRQDFSAVRPCSSHTAFFIKGIGDAPGEKVALHVWQQEAAGGSLEVAPDRNTIELQPVLKFSTRSIGRLRNRRLNFVVGLQAIPGDRPFLILGLKRTEKGRYEDATFRPAPNEQGWGEIVHTPGERIEFSFYAIDDDPAVRSVCRGT